MFCCAPAFLIDSNPEQTHLLHLNFATPGYLRALGMELRKGRWLTESEKDGVILLNESMAREAFGSADPIGRTPVLVLTARGGLHEVACKIGIFRQHIPGDDDA